MFGIGLVKVNRSGVEKSVLLKLLYFVNGVVVFVFFVSFNGIQWFGVGEGGYFLVVSLAVIVVFLFFFVVVLGDVQKGENVIVEQIGEVVWVVEVVGVLYFGNVDGVFGQFGFCLDVVCLEQWLGSGYGSFIVDVVQDVIVFQVDVQQLVYKMLLIGKQLGVIVYFWY